MSNLTTEDYEKAYFKDDVYGVVEEMYSEYRAIFQDYILESEKTVTVDEGEASTSMNNPQSTRLPQPLRLQQVEIAKFGGDYKSWRPFCELFVKFVDQENSFSNVEKMFHLKSLLTGDAERLIRHLQITASNYESAWRIIVKRYDNKRVLVNYHINALMNQRTLTTESVSGIREIVDTTNENMCALKNLSIDISTWDPIVIHIITAKLDSETLKLWEQSLDEPTEVPQLSQLITFLEARFHSLEFVGARTKNRYSVDRSSANSTSRSVKSFHGAENENVSRNKTVNRCAICDGNHTVSRCAKFYNLSPRKRRVLVVNLNLCFLCLKRGHNALNCKHEKVCNRCQQRHHRLIHVEEVPASPSSEHSEASTSLHAATSSTDNKLQNVVEDESSESDTSEISVNVAASATFKSSVLLATALVRVTDSIGSTKILRALLDQGSQCSFITENATQILGIRRKSLHRSITGIGSTNAVKSKGIVSILLRPYYDSDFVYEENMLILSEITNKLPSNSMEQQSLSHIAGLKLADPTFSQPGKIDILIGAELYAHILLEGLIKGPPGTPIAQKTKFGWIISGSNKSVTIKQPILSLHVRSEPSIDDLLKRFWEIEEVHIENSMTEEERLCEDHFQKTHKRCTNGRYVVSLPFIDQILARPSKISLGSSLKMAICRLQQMEKKFAVDNSLKIQYSKFMHEYESLGHMKPISVNALALDQEHCYLPHHSVLKLDSSTTKLRVVFDASAKTSSGISLNDKLMVGPTLQHDLASILIRWRKHRIAFSADIAKMYRQIDVAESDRNYQRIVWRNSTDKPYTHYELNTVTYGTSSAPYQAIRTLIQLATDERERFPVASKVVLNDFYVDDVMTGADNVLDAIVIKQQLLKMLESGGFLLRKWVANNKELLSDLPDEYLELKSSIPFETEKTVKTLGIRWNPHTDQFEFKVSMPESQTPPTKRSILSETSKLFDPIGWLCPCIITPKILMQQLWLAGISWNDAVPDDIIVKWLDFRRGLPGIEKIKINRWLGYYRNAVSYQLHGFSDASIKAYGAVVYLRTIGHADQINVVMISAKSRVAPTRQVSLPRLELCGALLLVNLMKKIKQTLVLENVKEFAWTDSTIVLSWLRGHPQKWKTFVANRVAEIQTYTNVEQWNYVRSEENPADCASRGMSPEELSKHELWWSGPLWLRNPIITSNTKHISSTEEEIKSPLISLVSRSHQPNSELLDRFSSMSRMVRVISLCIRFCANMRVAVANNRASSSTCVVRTKQSERQVLRMCISVDEIRDAKLRCIRLVQQSEFHTEFLKLKSDGHVQVNSKLKSLNPFIDCSGIIRVGGRLELSDLTYDAKHPIIIPHKTHLTQLIIREAHFKTLHGGNQLTLRSIRECFWILNARQAVKFELHRCTICHRYKTNSTQQLMGQIPKPRVSISRPFTSCGVDYAGPVDIRVAKGRGQKCYKGYIAVFVCLSTKAIHLEAVSDLTSQGFLAALNRFTSRRGQPRHLYSDNGTNFVGAEKIFARNVKSFLSSYEDEIIDTLSGLGMEWHRIPPASPHFGGLWEAGVKSVKHHLRRIVGNAILNFEELSTLLAQIESTLNSRPLCPMTNDSESVEVLTPGHFLVGTALLAPPSSDLTTISLNRLNRWQLVQRLHQNFWHQWSSDYLNRLQQRPKWLKSTPNVNVGALVLLKDEKMPPSKWPLCRVVETHAGKDGLVRVVTLKTQTSVIKRPVVKIAVLPISDNESNTKSDQSINCS